jgi:hypothetical protein
MSGAADGGVLPPFVSVGWYVPRMAVDRELVDAAIELARTRVPSDL